MVAVRLHAVRSTESPGTGALVSEAEFELRFIDSTELDRLDLSFRHLSLLCQ